MEIIVAQSAGFCFGVKNAVEKAVELAKEGKKVFTYGPIIHNKQVVNELQSRGISVINSIDDINQHDVIVIRSHGITKDEYENILKKGAEIIDATCPNVKRIHKIVQEKEDEGYKIIIIGDPDHPEVKGINGWCNNNATIINDKDDIGKIDDNLQKVCIVAQTTYNQKKWYSLICSLINCSKQVLMYNTICAATEIRQEEVNKLSKNVDAMLVVGGKESSNTQKLYQISKQNCDNTIFIENLDELDLDRLKSAKKIGITGGASTPDYVINEVVDKIKTVYDAANDNNSMDETSSSESNNNVIDNKDEEDYELYFADIYCGSIVRGKAIKVADREAFFDIGYKADAILPIEEDYNIELSLKEKYNPGDVVELEVIKMNDGEGNVIVSRKSLQREEYLDNLNTLKNDEKNIEVTVTGINKGGFSCSYGDVKAFMPVSLSGAIPSEDFNSYLGKKLQVRINEIKERREDIEIIVSRKEIIKEEKEKRVKDLFNNIAEGQIFSGTVKAIIKGGVFVNIGDIDVFVPISEISWRRINTPQDALNENQNVQVKIIRVDRDNLKATGSIKKSGKEPWEEFVTKFKEGETITGQVVRYAEYGAFVQLIDGLDGLIHISEMSDKRINKPQDVVKIGQEVKARIIKIDNETKRISLSLKDVD